MKKVLALMLLCLVVGCRQEPLADDPENDGRNAPEEKKDSASVTPSFDATDWEGSIDVNFGFG